MPVFMVDGQQYRIPSKTLSTGNKDICKQTMAKHATQAEATTRATRATRDTRDRATRATKHHQNQNNLEREWTAREDRLLRELIAFRVPWRRIAVTLGQRTMEDVQTRWRRIRGQTGKTEENRSTRTKPQRHVSFTDPLVTGGEINDSDPPRHTGDRDRDTDRDTDGDTSRDTHIKKVFYIDADFSLEEVVLLHNIAAKWERDRWLAISTRFNDLTQRAITPEQASSVVEES